MPKAPKRVLLVLGWYDHRLHRGIEQYAQAQGWHLSADLAREKVIPWGWEGDGILSWLGAGDDLAEFVVRADKPTVDFSFRRPQLPFARVLENTEHTARLVADHFLERGFENFLFYSDADNWVYEERGRAFVQAINDAGMECRWLRWHESGAFRGGRDEWKRKRSWILHQIKPPAKPVAVFCAADGLALDLLESCEAAGMSVPEEVAIVGAGNSLLAVDAMRIPVSSVDVNMEAIGYQGALLLDHLMKGGASASADPTRISPLRLVVRKSSDLVAITHGGVARSLRFLFDHCHEPIGVEDMVAASGMSRRSLHEAFLAHVGRPPGAELHRVRLERAKKLIVECDDKIEVIARQCGYQSGNSFWIAFKQATGTTPSEFRKQCLIRPPSGDVWDSLARDRTAA